jgi:hypothetical protein
MIDSANTEDVTSSGSHHLPKARREGRVWPPICRDRKRTGDTSIIWNVEVGEDRRTPHNSFKTKNNNLASAERHMTACCRHTQDIGKGRRLFLMF